MKKLLVSLLLAMTSLFGSAPASAFDLPRVDQNALQHFINTGSINGTVASRYDLGTQIVTNQKKIVRCTYDFSVQGGAISTIQLKSSSALSASKPLSTCVLPAGALITAAFVDVITTATSGGSATIAISSGQAAADLLTATAFGTFATGAHPLATIPVGTAATAFKLTADSIPSITIATATVTAGKFYLIIEYALSNTL